MAAVLIPVLAVASAAIGAVGSISQGISAQNAANYNAQVSRNNALTAARVGAAKEEAQRRQANLALGDQAAALAQADIGLGGSAADVQRQSRINASLDALNTRYAAQLQSQDYSQQAALMKYQGSQDLTSGILGAGSAILSGASDYGITRVRLGQKPFGF